MWISLQAVEALINAEQQGFVTGLNKHMVTDYLVAGFNLFGYRDKLTAIRLWKQLDAKVDYRKYIEETQAALYPKPTLYDKLLLLEAKQREEMPVILDTFLTKQFRTAMGNTYWGEENNRIRDNSVQTTLLMYRILKRAGHQENLLKRIRYYFLEKRKDGQWRNTYESSLILETILPDLMKTDAANQPAAFSLAGTQAATTISKFPYTASFSNREKITITGQKGMPVYFTAYQQGWNDNPLPVQGSFTVKTAFERNGDSIASLKGGENVTLNIQVKVKTDADYVMIEVPIPAGCSYQDKSPAYRNNEVHREYFKNKVSIFCSTLTAGDYTFSISLMPRYSGLYTLNPAKAEMMYFPVFYGREELKQVLIK